MWCNYIALEKALNSKPFHNSGWFPEPDTQTNRASGGQFCVYYRMSLQHPNLFQIINRNIKINTENAAIGKCIAHSDASVWLSASCGGHTICKLYFCALLKLHPLAGLRFEHYFWPVYEQAAGWPKDGLVTYKLTHLFLNKN